MIDTVNIIASIHFEERQPFKSVSLNDEVTVWVDTMINQSYYNTEIVTDLSVVKVSNHQYTITADATGFHNIEIKVTNKPSLKPLKESISNTLLLIVN